MARVSLPESKLKRNRRRRRTIFALFWALLLIMVVGAVAGLAYLPHWRVVAVEVEGVEGTEAQAVKELVEEHLKGSYGLVFPRDNIVIYPRSAIIADLLAEFPDFSAVKVRAKNLRTLQVEVALRSPKALWCGERRGAGSPCFLLDEQGVVYEPAAQLGSVYMSYYGATANNSLPKQFLAKEVFRSLAALVAALEEQQGKKITLVEVDEADDVYLRFASGFELRFTLESSGGDVFERFVLALSAEPFEGRAVSDFEYLDLRFGDRLYYKLKEE